MCCYLIWVNSQVYLFNHINVGGVGKIRFLIICECIASLSSEWFSPELLLFLPYCHVPPGGGVRRQASQHVIFILELVPPPRLNPVSSHPFPKQNYTYNIKVKVQKQYEQRWSASQVSYSETMTLWDLRLGALTERNAMNKEQSQQSNKILLE